MLGPTVGSMHIGWQACLDRVRIRAKSRRVYYLVRAGGRSIEAHNVALSDHEGYASLSIPRGRGDGEGSIARSPQQDDRVVATVPTRSLDTYGITGVGFLKIDVEGHEPSVLLGASKAKISSSRPTIFIEIEDRHSAGAVARVTRMLISDFGYKYAYFVFEGKIRDLSEFDLRRHQLNVLPDIASPSYVSNFVFSDYKVI